MTTICFVYILFNIGFVADLIFFKFLNNSIQGDILLWPQWLEFLIMCTNWMLLPGKQYNIALTVLS